MNVYEFFEMLKKFYPDELSCPWDNDGIDVTPGGVREVSRVLVALDATEEAINYAASNGFDTLLVHHPLIFSPLGAITPERNASRKAIFALMNDITVISLHTRLDAGEGGVNDCLAEALGLKNVSKFGDDESPDCGRIGEIESEMDVERFAGYVKEMLGSPSVALSSIGDETVRRVAVVGGAGKDFIDAARRAGADVLVTGEASYNSIIDAAEDSLPVICAGHYHTERVVLPRLAELAVDAGAEYELFYNTTVKVI